MKHKEPDAAEVLNSATLVSVLKIFHIGACLIMYDKRTIPPYVCWFAT